MKYPITKHHHKEIKLVWSPRMLKSASALLVGAVLVAQAGYLGISNSGYIVQQTRLAGQEFVYGTHDFVNNFYAVLGESTSSNLANIQAAYNIEPENILAGIEIVKEFIKKELNTPIPEL